jgi:hypothetical protein
MDARQGEPGGRGDLVHLPDGHVQQRAVEHAITVLRCHPHGGPRPGPGPSPAPARSEHGQPARLPPGSGTAPLLPGSGTARPPPGSGTACRRHSIMPHLGMNALSSRSFALRLHVLR